MDSIPTIQQYRTYNDIDILQTLHQDTANPHKNKRTNHPIRPPTPPLGPHPALALKRTPPITKVSGRINLYLMKSNYL